MRKTTRRLIAAVLLMLAPLVGTTFAPGCVETALLAVNPCGTVLENCTPQEWYELIWPIVNAPDYERDPSCSIPYACGTWTGDTPGYATTTGTSD